MNNVYPEFREPLSKEEARFRADKDANIAEMIGHGAIGSAEFDFVSPDGDSHHSDSNPDHIYIETMHPNLDFSHPAEHSAVNKEDASRPAMDPFNIAS